MDVLSSVHFQDAGKRRANSTFSLEQESEPTSDRNDVASDRRLLSKDFASKSNEGHRELRR
jgi:hypothetical protein